MQASEGATQSVASQYARYQKDSLTYPLAVAALGEDYIGQTSSATWPQVKAKVTKLKLPPESKVLDLGCGTGPFACKLAEEFPISVVGIDFSEDLIALANKVALTNKTIQGRVTFHCEDFSKLESVNDDQFQLALSVGSLYWNDDIEHIIQLWSRKIAASGHLIIFANMQCNDFDAKEKQLIDNTKFVKHDLLTQYLNSAGFTVVETENGTATYIEWLTRWCGAMDTHRKAMEHKMGTDQFGKFADRFQIYLQLARADKVRRLVITAQKI